MKLVINISENYYNHLMPLKLNDEEHLSYDMEMIRNGTPLPKGHGRLGDLDALEKEIIGGIKKSNYEEGYEEFLPINTKDDIVDCVRYADAIIEADKTKSEEE